MPDTLENEAESEGRLKMGSCAEERSDATNSRVYMENVSTACNVRVKRCSTAMNISHGSSAEEQKQNTSHDRASKERTSSQDLAKTNDILNARSGCESHSQNAGAMKATDSPGDDNSCISGLDALNTVVENCSNCADRKNDGSGSSVSVNSSPSSEKACNGSQTFLYKMSGNSEESINNHMERSMKTSEPCVFDSSRSPPLKEPSPKKEASVSSEEKEESSSTAIPFREAAEAPKLSDTKECKEEQLLSTDHSYSVKLPRQTQPADMNAGFGHADEEVQEVRVCDICGDIGREDLLAICTNCNDGAEHIYCMRIQMEKVPAGNWLCEECTINEESLKERERKIQEEEKLLKRSNSINTTGKHGSPHPSDLKKRLQVLVGTSSFEKKTASATSCSPKTPSKISPGNPEASPITKRRILEIRDESPKGIHPRKLLSRDGSSSSPKSIAEGKVKPFAPSSSARTNFSVSKSCLLKSKSFNGGDMRLKDHHPSIVPKDHGKGVQNKVLSKSQSFRDAHAEYPVPDISKAKKIQSPISRQMDNQIRVNHAEDHSSSPRKNVLKFGSSKSKGDEKANVRIGKLRPVPSSSAKHLDQEIIQGRGHLTNSSKFGRIPQKVPGDQHEANYEKFNNVKTELVFRANELNVNGSPRRHYLEKIVPSQGGVIPEVDFIWKGGFEVSRSEGLTNFFPCIQAHKSNRACDKVGAFVKKLPQNIVLDEAPRLSSWPAQFKDDQATEEDIALFFFAENLASYGAYASLLERLTVNNLALKVCIEGVELLIFPSKVLPPKSQRWNNLLYLWGVFRMTSIGSTKNGPTSLGRYANSTTLQSTSTNELPLASTRSVHEISEPVPSSSGPKLPDVRAIDHELSIVDSSTISSPSRERDLYGSRKVDEDRIDRKMKAVVNELPEPCIQSHNKFFEVGPLLYNPASSSGAGIINNAETRIPSVSEKSILEEHVDLELALGPMGHHLGKRKALSLSFDAVDDMITCPTKRPRKDEDERSLSLSLSLSLAPPS